MQVENDYIYNLISGLVLPLLQAAARGRFEFGSQAFILIQKFKTYCRYCSGDYGTDISLQ